MLRPPRFHEPGRPGLRRTLCRRRSTLRALATVRPKVEQAADPRCLGPTIGESRSCAGPSLVPEVAPRVGRSAHRHRCLAHPLRLIAPRARPCAHPVAPHCSSRRRQTLAYAHGRGAVPALAEAFHGHQLGVGLPEARVDFPRVGRANRLGHFELRRPNSCRFAWGRGEYSCRTTRKPRKRSGVVKAGGYAGAAVFAAGFDEHRRCGSAGSMYVCVCVHRRCQ